MLGLSTITYTSLIVLSAITVIASLIFSYSLWIVKKKNEVKAWLHKVCIMLLPILIATVCISISSGTGYTNSLISCHSACSGITDIKQQTSQSCVNSICSSSVFSEYSSNLSYHLYGICVSVFLLFIQVATFSLATTFVIEIEESTQKVVIGDRKV